MTANVSVSIARRQGALKTMILPSTIIGAFFFSAAVGIFFGFYPARKAAALDPLDSLGYE